MTIETKPFDAAEVLNSDERIAAYCRAGANP